MAHGALLCQQRKFHDRRAESVSCIYRAGENETEAGPGPAYGYPVSGQGTEEGRISEAGENGERPGKRTDRHDHGDYVRHRDSGQ